MPTLAFTLHHQAVVLFKPWFVWRSTASLTSSVSPVHMRSRSTSRFCLMLLMLSISWRTASAVLHTRKPTQNEKQDNNFVYSVLFSEYRISKMFFSLLMFHLKSWTNKHCDNLQHTAYKYYLIRNIFLGSTFICSKNECLSNEPVNHISSSFSVQSTVAKKHVNSMTAWSYLLTSWSNSRLWLRCSNWLFFTRQLLFSSTWPFIWEWSPPPLSSFRWLIWAAAQIEDSIKIGIF